MACTDCGNDCFLVDSKCIGKYTPLKSFTEQELSASFHAANAAIKGITGNCDLCENFGEENYKYTEIIATPQFRAYYSYLVYSFWIRTDGAGKPTKEGFTTKESDDFSNFRVNTENEITAKLDRIAPILEMYKAQFIEYFKGSNASCFDEECTSCTGDCTCSEVVKDGSSLEIFGYKKRNDFSTGDMATI